MSRAELVPVTHVDAFWPHVREGFQRALLKTGGDLETGDLWALCRSGAGYLIVINDEDGIIGAAILKAETWSSGRKMRVMALYGAGAADWFADMKALAIRIAKDCGATAIVADGRKGWPKFAPNARVLRVVYEEQI